MSDHNKAYIISCITQRFSTKQAHREEALREILALTSPDKSDEALAHLAASIPALPAELYAKWAALFADRILETVPGDQVRELCKPTDDNRATITLLFAMFMESERMEKQIAEDLKDRQKNETPDSSVY